MNGKKVLKEIISWIVCVAVVLVASYLIVTYIGQRTIVEGHSMETTLSDGDNLIVDKISYRFNEPKRFDIVVFPYEYEEKNYIKRVMGMPGETVQVIDGYLYINGSKFEENYCDEVMEYPGIAAEPITLGADEYFVLGDNRNHSSDSREESVGVIHRDKLIGKAVLRIWPLSEFGKIVH